MYELHSEDAGLAWAPVEVIDRRRLILLRRQLAYAIGNSPFYRKHLSLESGQISSLTTWEDFAGLPFTSKEDLAENNNDFLAIPNEEIADICQTSGTTGRPVNLFQSASDLERLAYNEARSFAGCGISSRDRVVIACALGRSFMAGLAYYLGLQKLGATTLRTGSNSLSHTAEVIKNLSPTALVCVPSLGRILAEKLKESGFDPAQSGIRRIICIGEPVRNSSLALNNLGQSLQESWQAEIFGTYASSEMATAFCDCEHGCGGHVHPELIIVEIVDEKGAVVADGEPGEVVVTPLGITGTPLIRFKTGDIAFLIPEKCACGRLMSRLSPIIGRKNQMLKVKGCTFFPPAIFEAVREIPGIEHAYLEVSRIHDLSDHIKLVVSVSDQKLDKLMIAALVTARTRVKPEVVIESGENVEQRIYCGKSRKPVVFFDLR